MINLSEAWETLPRAAIAPSRAPVPVRAAARRAVVAATPKTKNKNSILPKLVFGGVTLAVVIYAVTFLLGRDTDVESREGVYTVEDRALLLDQSNEMPVKLEGVLEDVKRSNNGTGKTVYLFFAGGGDKLAARGGLEVANAREDLAEYKLAGLKGKKLQIEGKVRGIGSGSSRYPVVMFEQRDAIKEIK